MRYIKNGRNGVFMDSHRNTSSFYTNCLGAWHFMRPTALYPDLTLGRHRLDRRLTGTQSLVFESKFPGIVPSSGNTAPADRVALISSSYTGIRNAIATYDKFSVAVWFRALDGEDNGQSLIQIGGEATRDDNYGIFIKNGGVNILTFSNGTAAPLDGTKNALDVNWHFAVGTYNGALSSNKRKFYFDGKLDTQDNTASVAPASGGIALSTAGGAVNDIEFFFAGIWGRDLDYEEIDRMYNDPFAMLNYPLLDRTGATAGGRIFDLMPWFQD